MNSVKNRNSLFIDVVLATAVSLAVLGTEASATATPSDYSFGLAGSPQSEGGGKSIVAVTVTHDGKPVTGAILIQSRADMSPIGMASMTAPIKPLGEQPPGTYRFEVDNGSVWKKPDNWSLSFDAKVQGVAQTVSGSVTVKLSP